MAKPFANQPGSGLHFHVSLWQGDRCLFNADGVNDNVEVGSGNASGLSLLGRQFMAGVLHHAAPLCALAAPTVNSCKRLVVGESLSGTSWAPAYVAHGPNNRTALVRTLPGRFEWRLPDASANPYLATAAILAIAPSELCLVAAHHSDLAAARRAGLLTAYVDRPMERGGAPAPDRDQRQDWDWQSDSLTDLAVQLGC